MHNSSCWIQRMNLCTIKMKSIKSFFCSSVSFCVCVCATQNKKKPNKSFTSNKWSWLHLDIIKWISFISWLVFFVHSFLSIFFWKRPILIQICVALTWKRLIKSCSQPILSRNFSLGTKWIHQNQKSTHSHKHMKWWQKALFFFSLCVVIQF